MRGIAFALVALSFAATTPDPVAAQCFGPECDRQRSGPQAYPVRPNFHSNPANNGHLYRSVPYDQGRPYQGQQYQVQPFQGQQQYQGQPYQGQPHQGQPYQGPPYQQGQQYQGQPYQQGQQHQRQPYQPAPHPQSAYQQPAYQGQLRPPVRYSNVPPGMAPGVAPGGRGYQPSGPDGRTEVRTRVTKISKPAKSGVRQQQPAPNSRTVVRHASPPADAGQVTISVAEYRDLQNQARELQRMRGARGGASRGMPPGAPANGASPFPDVPPPGGR